MFLAESLPQSLSFQLKTNRKAKFCRGQEVLVGDAASMPTLAPSGPFSPLGTWPCAGSTFPGLTVVTQPGLLWEAPGGIGFAK